MTVLRRISPKEYWNAFTGVSREFRGNGIAKTLKRLAANVAFHQGAERIRTFNLSVNEPVLKVNRSLGYVREPGHWIMERDYV
jgi:mycothiol synthase